MTELVRWSIDLLEPADAELLERLAVLPGRFTVHDVEVLLVDDGERVDVQRVLDTLVDASLVAVDRGAAAAGYRLGILSNVDDDLLQATLRHFHAPNDLIVTAQQVGSYKPAHGHFVRARERIGDRRWLHAAQSHFHDVVPCSALGLPVVWVNRKREPLPAGGPVPLAEVATMAGLADWLGAKG